MGETGIDDIGMQTTVSVDVLPNTDASKRRDDFIIWRGRYRKWKYIHADRSLELNTFLCHCRDPRTQDVTWNRLDPASVDIDTTREFH